MIRILNNEYTIDEKWCKPYFEQYIKAHHKVIVVAFSFRDTQVKSIENWDELYSKNGGIYYTGIVSSLMSYGIIESNISFINYFNDTIESAKEKIRSADVIYLPGGLPEKMFERLNDFDLTETILEHNGIILGYSAGAMIQLSEYHITPDKDYPSFEYYEGIGLLSSFGIEVHYTNSEIQRTSIKRFVKEKKKPVYAIGDKGALIINNNSIQMIGDVKLYSVDSPSCLYILI